MKLSTSYISGSSGYFETFKIVHIQYRACIIRDRQIRGVYFSYLPHEAMESNLILKKFKSRNLSTEGREMPSILRSLCQQFLVYFFRMTAKTSTPNTSPRILLCSFDHFLSALFFTPKPHHFLLLHCLQFQLSSPVPNIILSLQQTLYVPFLQTNNNQV